MSIIIKKFVCFFRILVNYEIHEEGDSSSNHIYMLFLLTMNEIIIHFLFTVVSWLPVPLS